MTLVPTVDLERWWEGDEPARRSIAEALDHAARTVGFMQIVGHRVPEVVISAMRDRSDEFFALPDEFKRSTSPRDPSVNRGYAAPGTESLSYSIGDTSPPDLFEAFNIGEEHVDRHDPYYGDDPFGCFAPNIWPADSESFRTALVAYFAEVRRVAIALTDVFAGALDLPARWFRPFVDRSTTTLRVINYERFASSPATGQLRMGAHTDYGVVTVLWADETPGLEVLAGDGRWHHVEPEPGAFLVNLGDLTARWTNDRWLSTLHRVTPPPSSVGAIARRRSAAFFLDANWNARIDCLPTCTDADHPPKYPPVIAGEHLMAKLMAPRTARPSTATDTAADRPGRERPER